MRNQLWLVVVMTLFLAACQDTGPKPVFISGTDGRPASATGKDHFIEFRSRYALSYGHTYVVYGRLDKAGNYINPQVAGLHPKSYDEVPYVVGHFLPVPAETGWSDGDLEEEYRSASWRVMLTEAEYNKTVAYVKDLQARTTTWNATVNNCNAFVGEIARSMGYKVPGIWLRPQQFVTRLREMATES